MKTALSIGDETKRWAHAHYRRRTDSIEVGPAATLVAAVLMAVGGWQHRWVSDDAFIDFRVVNNLLHGHGPVFNPGERVEVFTDPLWVFLLSLFHGVFRFVSLEWTAVLLGLALTVAGVCFAGSAVIRLAGVGGLQPVLPIGLFAAAAVDSVWDFTTSGLETGLIFGWEGVSWWMIVRVYERREKAVAAAFVCGLGPLIRPDLILISLCLIGALAVLVGRTDWAGPTSLWHRWLLPTAAAAGLPLLYQLWRMAYFALIVPNTALAKSAGLTEWKQGLTYLEDFVKPYWLWIPLGLALLTLILHLAQFAAARQYAAMAVLGAPVVGGLINGLYVIRVGGDFMHARMLLPCFFAVCMTWYTRLRVREEQFIVLVGLCWAVVCGVGLRYNSLGINFHTGIANERAYWVAVTRSPHPVTVSDWRRSPLEAWGLADATVARQSLPAGSGYYEVVVNSRQDLTYPRVIVSGHLNERVVAPGYNIGILGYLAGANVYIFDQDSLANPVGSHLRLRRRGRPGHEKYIGLDWMLARFVPPGLLPSALAVAPDQSQLSITDVTQAQQALSCGTLARYVHAITAPLSWHLALNNVLHAVSYTDFSFDVNPSQARSELCGPTQ